MGLLAFLILVLIGLASTVGAYAAVATNLPAPDELIRRASQLQSTRIYARDGTLLQQPLAPDDLSSGLRRRVPLDQISPYVIQATIATEDSNFYSHRGVDPVALGRAVYSALRTRGPIMGTSTISQQLVKWVFLSPERSITRKVKEAILAAEITRRYSKNTILELYLNEIYYGNLAYGIEAASQLYFAKPASELTLAEASLLAGLPQSPATYDPLQNPEAAKSRQADVLRLMVEAGFIGPAEADAAWQEQLSYYSQGLETVRLSTAPHFVMFVRSQLEQNYGPELMYRGGLQIFTTLEPSLQRRAEVEVRQGVDAFRDRNASNSALVAIQPQTGEILSMVGSADFFDQEIDGQVNVVLAPRQPGSSIKPFTYLATFEAQPDYWTPATMIEDARTEFDDGPGRPPYVPRNYDGQEHGWVSVREALANSLNIPAVKALEHVGVDALLDVAQRFGIDTLVRPGHPPYGLSLTLGGGEVTLLELTAAYGALANGGVRVPPASILCVLDGEGRVVERLDIPRLPAECATAPLAPNAIVQQPLAQQVARADHVYLLTNILQDNDARTPTFGANSALRLDRPAAAKTGTTNDVRDGWTIGYTPDLVTGVWMGNSDGSPMDQSFSGSQGAAVIWNGFMQDALAGIPPSDFTVPAGVERHEVCRLTGTAPDDSCPAEQRLVEVFAAGQPPAGTQHGQSPTALAITVPQDGDPVQGVVRILGSAAIPDFAYYLVEYGETYEPGAWGLVAGPASQPVVNSELALWDVERLPVDGPHVLRVVAVDSRGNRHESPAVRVEVIKSSPQPTATDTPAPVDIPTATPSPSPTTTLVPSTVTPTASPSPTVAPIPEQPTPTPTAAPEATPNAPVVAVLDRPLEGVFSGLATLTGEAGGSSFLSYRLEFSSDQVTWLPIDPALLDVFTPAAGIIGIWNTTTLSNGTYTVRLLVQGFDGSLATAFMTVSIAN